MKETERLITLQDKNLAARGAILYVGMAHNLLAFVAAIVWAVVENTGSRDVGWIVGVYCTALTTGLVMNITAEISSIRFKRRNKLLDVELQKEWAELGGAMGQLGVVRPRQEDRPS